MCNGNKIRLIHWKEDTKDEQGVRKGAEDGEEEAADDAGADDLEEYLAPCREKLGGEEHQVSVDQHQEEVTQNCGRAG